MATTRSTKRRQLRRDAELPEVIAAVNELAESFAARRTVSPSDPLDAPAPSASIVYTDDEYDALSERLDAPAAPNEALGRTMSGGPTSER